MPVRFSESKRAEIRRHYFNGEGFEGTARAVGCSIGMVFKLVGKYPKRPRSRGLSALSIEEREEISRAIRAGDSGRCIAGRLARAPSTISREIAAGGGRLKYRAWLGEQAANEKARRPKVSKLASCAKLRIAVEQGLSARWSPQQIEARLLVDYPDDLTMRISHESIYRSLFVQGRGELRKELAKHLRSGRLKRRIKPRAGELRGQILDKVMISERPAEADDRAVPGHWEGDLIIGKLNRSSIGTLVERHSRYVILLHLPLGRTADLVREALEKKIVKLPTELCRSVTWDQGSEMKGHAKFTIATGVKVYFCDPHSPWQRGSNENTNGLLRQYFPKGEDLSLYTQKDLNDAARSLNGRPRQTLGWRTPFEVFGQAVASAG